MTIYDPSKNEWKVNRNVVQDQSIVGLAYKDGKIYGSTSIYGGLGADPKASKAKMFVWNVAKNEKIKEFDLNSEGINNPVMISGLTIGSDGLLWGAADGTIFAINTDTLEVVKSKNIYPDIKGYGRWRPVYSRWAKDGILYSNVGGKLTAIDTKTLDAAYIVDTGLYTLGSDDNIYYTDGVYLEKILTSNKVTGISLRKKSVNIKPGDSEKLEVVIRPENALEKSVQWSSDNEKVATVDENGLVKGISAGKATITVTSKDGSFKDSCKVIVLANKENLNNKITEAKNLYDNSIEGTKAGEYPKAARESLKKSIESAEAILASDGLTQLEVDNVQKNLEVSIELLKKSIIKGEEKQEDTIKEETTNSSSNQSIKNNNEDDNLNTASTLPKTGSAMDFTSMIALGLLIFGIGIFISRKNLKRQV